MGGPHGAGRTREKDEQGGTSKSTAPAPVPTEQELAAARLALFSGSPAQRRAAIETFGRHKALGGASEC